MHALRLPPQHPCLAKEELCALCYLVLADFRCIAIEGCSGSGKTTLLKNFIKVFDKKVGEDVVFLHLGDQIDGKVCDVLYIVLVTGRVSCRIVFVVGRGVCMYS